MIIIQDVICLGELLIDFISVNKNASLTSSEGFLKNPGGAPANVAAGVSRLGFSSGFIGKVGKDQFGYYLKNVLDDINVDTSKMVFDEQYRTTLSFVALKAEGDRDCMFYRNPGADMMLQADEIDEEYIKKFKIFHFGSISLGNEPCKSATLKAIEYAKKNGLIVSYDPNLRLSLWETEEKAKTEINNGFKYADVVKISEEEFEFITGCKTNEDCANYILQTGVKLVIITLGSGGCFYSNGKDSGYVEGFSVDTIETTGAGDAFVAAFLTKLLARINDATLFEIDENMLHNFRFANAAGAIATTKMGAIPSLPNTEAVFELYSITK